MGLTDDDAPAPASALAIGAHPDDIEFGCGATLAKWASHGCTVHHLVLTDGSKGTWDPDADTEALVRTRHDEARAAAHALGATGQVVLLGAVDGDLEATAERRNEVAHWIRSLRPTVVLGHDPWQRYRLHPDHRQAGWLTVDACVVARDPHFATSDHSHADRLPHHRPEALWLFEADEPDHVEDVEGFAERKIDALLEHTSQWVSTMFIDPDDDGTQLEAFRDRVRGTLCEHAVLATPARQVRHGEAFKVLPL